MAKNKKSPAREKCETELEIAKARVEGNDTPETRRELIKAYEGLAFACKDEKDITKALENYLYAYKISKELFEKDGSTLDMESLAACCGDLGAISKVIGNNTKALEFYLEAIDLQKKAADTLRLAPSYNKLALLYFEAALINRRKPDKAMINKALDIWDILIKEHPENEVYQSLRSSGIIVLNEKYLKKQRGVFARFARRRSQRKQAK